MKIVVYIGMIMLLLVFRNEDTIQIKNNLSYFDSTLCDKYRILAQKHIAKDSFFLSRKLMSRLSITSKEILKRNFNIYEENLPGDFRLKETVCYYEYMISAIANKYGDSLLNNVSKCSDSLDAIGKGYKDSKLKTEIGINELFRKEFPYIKDFDNDSSLTVLISIKISDKGNIDQILIYEGKLSTVGTLLPSRNTKYIEATKTLLTKYKWEPAMLNGKNVNSSTFILLNKFYLK